MIDWLTVPAKRQAARRGVSRAEGRSGSRRRSRRAAEYILAAIGLAPFPGNFQGQQVELALEIA